MSRAASEKLREGEEGGEEEGGEEEEGEEEGGEWGVESWKETRPS